MLSCFCFIDVMGSLSCLNSWFIVVFSLFSTEEEVLIGSHLDPSIYSVASSNPTGNPVAGFSGPV